MKKLQKQANFLTIKSRGCNFLQQQYSDWIQRVPNQRPAKKAAPIFLSSQRGYFIIRNLLLAYMGRGMVR
jgi:hypothetical protein